MIFIIINKTPDTFLLGHLTGHVVNDSKCMVELELKVDKSWKIIIRGKKVQANYIGVSLIYSVGTIFDIVRKLNYCKGTQNINVENSNMKYFKEHVSKVRR